MTFQIQLIGADGASVTKDGPAGTDGPNGSDGPDGQSSWGRCVKPAEDGQPGQPGTQPRKAEDGGNGAPPPTLNLKCHTIVGTLALLIQGGKGGNGGNGGPGGNGGNGGKGGKQAPACKKKYGATQGGMGGDGGRGGDAGTGGNGGDCGHVLVRYDNAIPNPIECIDTRNAAATGGDPGKPGRGGVKGIGGLSGDGKTKRSDGMDGAYGNIAQSGSNGNAGRQDVRAISQPCDQLVIQVILER